jgi:hypothetical protein
MAHSKYTTKILYHHQYLAEPAKFKSKIGLRDVNRKVKKKNITKQKASSITTFTLLAKGICQECRLTELIECMLSYMRALMKRMQYMLRVAQPSFQLCSSLHLPQTPPPLLPASKSHKH